MHVALSGGMSNANDRQVEKSAKTLTDVQTATPDENTETPLKIPSSAILCGRLEVWIEHGSEMYRLRVTSSGKLILSK
jgi:hemin uptake protein HemP